MSKSKPPRPTTRVAMPAGPRRTAVPRLWSAAIALAVFAVYLLQTPGVTGDKDSAEFTLVLALDGVAHPTGYPLFTLFGHPWTVLVHTLGASWPFAANSWTGLGGAVAIYLMQRLALALIPVDAALGRLSRFGLALLPVAVFAFNPLWTYEAELAEVYTWHVAWVLGAALAFVRLLPRVTARQAPPAGTLLREALMWGVLCGVGGAHHVTALFVAAPLSLALVVALLVRRRMRLTLAAAVVAGTILPLLSYGILYWRAAHPVAAQWPLLKPGWQGLVFHVTGGQYTRQFGGFQPSPVQVQLLGWYLWPMFVPGLLLLLVNATRATSLGTRTVGWALAASALAGTAYAFEYEVPDPSSYFLYPLALGCIALVPLLADMLTARPALRRAGVAVAVAVALGAMSRWGGWLRTGEERVRMFQQFDDYVGRMWSAIPFEHGFVFWSNDMYYKLLERQRLEGQKPGLDVEHAPLLLIQPVRGRFAARQGFDPGEGVACPPDLDQARGARADTIRDLLAHEVEERVNALSPLPVIHFDPQIGAVRLLRKPGAPPDSARH